jgi:glycosyltransferase involved in cell wall biosynthesis
VVVPVFRDADRAIELVCSLQRQKLPPGTSAEIVVVDDGSGDGTAERMAQALGSAILLHRLAANAGRAVARNTGAAIASGEWLLFVDCDCMPVDDELIQAHAGEWRPGVVASVGPVVGDGGFWHRYQSAASDRRARQHAAGLRITGSSQNLMVSASAFRACGGFDTAYRAYGFEDRDLQLRIAAHGSVCWAAKAVVRHMDSLSMVAVSGKLVEAGGTSARLFSTRHPQAYRDLGYAALDVRLHPWLRPPARVIEPLIPPLARFTDRLVRASVLPYRVKSWLVKGLSGASYLVGTLK